MSSVSEDSSSNNSGEKNCAEIPDGSEQHHGRLPKLDATSTTCAEAQQGDGPATACTRGSEVAENADKTTSVSTCIGIGYPIGPRLAAAASHIGVVAVHQDGAAATRVAANAGSTAVSGNPTAVD